MNPTLYVVKKRVYFVAEISIISHVASPFKYTCDPPLFCTFENVAVSNIKSNVTP